MGKQTNKKITKRRHIHWPTPSWIIKSLCNFKWMAMCRPVPSCVQNCQMKMFKTYACLKRKNDILSPLTSTEVCCQGTNWQSIRITLNDDNFMQFVVNLVNGSLDGRQTFNSSSLWQNGRHFAEDIFRCIFVNGKFCILIRISLKFGHKGTIDKNPAPVQTMPWRRTRDKPLSKPMLTQFIDAYMRH